MKLATIQGAHGPSVVALRGDDLVNLSEVDSNAPQTLKDWITDWPKQRDRLAKSVASAPALQEPPQRWLAPIPDPQKVICIGLNYADHAAETGTPIPTEPVVFAKFPTAVTGHLEPIELPSVSQQVDYEAELVVVIGKAGRDITAEDAWKHVAGFTCGHDVSARDWQKGKPGGQWLLGKSFDTFAPMGPFLTLLDESPSTVELDIRLHLSGETLQDSNTRQLIFPIDRLIAYVSSVATLLPGDVIFTGTPPGVGVARAPQRFLQPGDVAVVEIEGLGKLENPVTTRS